MKPRKFHIWDFPEHKVKILLKDHDQFLIDCANQFGSMKKFSEFLNLPSYTVSSWKCYKLYIPLWCLKKIVNKLQLNKRDIEKRIISYKGINTSKPIKSPILPIKEIPELFAIITHLIGDGCVSKGQLPMYVNSNRKLFLNFKDSLKKTFGKVHINTYGSKSGIYQCCFSKTIIDVINTFYNVKFNSFDAKFPKEIFCLSKKFACTTLGTIVDDEGCIRDNRIIISMKSKELIYQIKDLFIKILGKDSVNPPTMRENGSWSVTVNSFAIKKFGNHIKLIHPGKKKDILYAIKKATLRLNGKGEGVWNTKLRILRFLKSKSLSTKEIAKKVFISPNNIALHLNKLYKENLVKGIKKRHSYIWCITGEGLLFSKKWTLNNKRKKIKLPNWQRIFDLQKKQSRVLLNNYGRKRLFWMLKRVLKNQYNSAKFFNVHHNTIGNWKNGDSLLPLSTLNNMLIFLGDNGIDIVNEMAVNIQEIRSMNARSKLYGGK